MNRHHRFQVCKRKARRVSIAAKKGGSIVPPKPQRQSQNNTKRISRLVTDPTLGTVTESPNQGPVIAQDLRKEVRSTLQNSETGHSPGKTPKNISSSRNKPTLNPRFNHLCKAMTDKNSSPPESQASLFKNVRGCKNVTVVQQFFGKGRRSRTKPWKFGNVSGGLGGKGGRGVDGGPGGTGGGPIFNSKSPHMTVSFR
ncbi:hypothetical protein B0H14DRAFT_3131410 [Mycena olivaceomarginata]|nr:hypothetical protein B0H14DRAFT_3131410 [Mycena olivaceomarginata]